MSIVSLSEELDNMSGKTNTINYLAQRVPKGPCRDKFRLRLNASFRAVLIGYVDREYFRTKPHNYPFPSEKFDVGTSVYIVLRVIQELQRRMRISFHGYIGTMIPQGNDIDIRSIYMYLDELISCCSSRIVNND
jgi:hypothetical protein